MLRVKGKENFSLEEKYVISVLLSFLNVDFEFVEDQDRDYVLDYHGASIQICNAFWGTKKDKEKKYSEIPNGVVWVDACPWFRELAFLYGENVFEVQDKRIYCGGDIFGSAFFMLTRWEELVLPKDKFGRCDENEMFVVKHGLYKRPIVNEYIELLRKMLEHIGVEMKERQQKYHPFITHDVDDLFRFSSLKNFCKNQVGDLLHRKSMKAFFQTWLRYLRYRAGQIRDPFDTFDEMMDLSERFGLKDAFYFMPTYGREYDARYDIRNKRIKLIVENIIKRGHEVGIHPSKNTFNNLAQFEEEVGRLRDIYEGIKGGRQHYLLYSLPDTLEAWDENGLEYDAGLGFAFRGGFRCGICYPYPFFDVVRRKELSLVVRPLVMMEAALLRENINLEEVKKEVVELADTVRNYDGEFVFLWHTDNLHRQASMRFSDLYKEIVEYIA